MISIIVPNFNKGKFLKETIHSIINQTSNQWELIIVDDGSTDCSISTIRIFTEENKNIKLFIRNKLPKGANTCRNIGLEKAKGEFVIFLDSDDILAPFCIERRSNLFKQHSHLDFLICTIGNFNEKIGDTKFIWKTSPNANHLKLFLRHDLPWHTSSPIWKKDFLIRIGGFNESYQKLQDVELHTRVLLNVNIAYKIFNSTEADCFYRTSPERYITNMATFLSNFIISVNKYISDVQEIISKKSINTSSLLKAMKGTIITAIKHIEYHNKQGKISITEKENLLHLLMNNSSVNRLLKNKDKIIIKYYIIGLENKMDVIKGYNFFVKKLIISS